MEWVETTGRTVEEAKDAALDQLGVDEQDAEFEVLEEPKSGLFGRLRQEARVRARVRPTRPRPKVERRDKRRRAGSGQDGGRDTSGPESEKPARQPRSKPAPAAETTTGDAPMEPRDLDTQSADVQSFLEGLLAAFDAEGTVVVDKVDEETLEARVDGGDLGLLIGPKGQTLQAIQELARAVLSKDGPNGARLRVDVGGYQERRREALVRFSRTVADQVLASGTPASLEPMGAADRKVVHDTINGIDGVHTVSEGDEPRRRVVVMPGGADD